MDIGAKSNPSTENFHSKWPNPFEKRWLWQISAFNISTVRDSKNIKLRRIRNWPQTFQRAIDGVLTLPLSPAKGGSKTDFSVFRSKIQLQLSKVCYKVSLCENSSKSVSYEITEKYSMESVSFHLKYWLKLTYLLLCQRAQHCRMTAFLKYSADNCTVNFSDIGTAHCSHTVSVLANLLFVIYLPNCGQFFYKHPVCTLENVLSFAVKTFSHVKYSLQTTI